MNQLDVVQRHFTCTQYDINGIRLNYVNLYFLATAKLVVFGLGVLVRLVLQLV